MPKRVFRLAITSGICGCLLSCWTTTGLAQVYTVTDVGTLYPGSFGFADGINNPGAVVGTSAANAFPNLHAYLYSGGVLSDLGSLGTPGAGTFSQANGINQFGQVVGVSTTNPTGSIQHAFFWNGTMNDLFPNSTDFSTANAINAAGQIAGQIGGYGFIYSGNITLLNTFNAVALSTSTATGINGPGQVTGSYQAVSGDVILPPHAFVYTNGAVKDLGTLGGSDSGGTGINDAGQVTGSADVASEGKSLAHAFRFSGGVLTDLGTLVNSNVSVGRSIDSTGVVVGGSGCSGPDPQAPPGCTIRAFVWMVTTGMVDLNSLIDANSGWSLITATGINDRGQIAGNGMINGQTHPFLLTPLIGSLLQLSLQGLRTPLSVCTPCVEFVDQVIPEIPPSPENLSTPEKAHLNGTLHKLQGQVQSYAARKFITADQATLVDSQAQAILDVISPPGW